MTRAEQGVSLFVCGFTALLVVALLTGGLTPSYTLYLAGLTGMYVLLSLGLNAQWGYTGLINFSVAAFFGLGAYGAALVTASNSPLAIPGGVLVGLVLAVVGSAVVATAIAIPTLRLRADYLAIASLGLAEVVRQIVLNQRDWTNGSGGLRGIPDVFAGWPVLGPLPGELPGLQFAEYAVGIPGLFRIRVLGFTLGEPFWTDLLNFVAVVVFVAAVYLLLRRVHRSPWGRVLRTIRSDEELASALGKDTYAFKLQSFVLGSVVMALGGVFYAYLVAYVDPGDLEPINTFYVWIAVILGGSGSNRGAMFGGFVVVAIREGTRFASDILPARLPVDVPVLVDVYGAIVSDFGSTRLLIVGLLIVLVMRLRPEGVLPPQRELLWPSALEETDE
ncbi:branched-chain amino acid ABC transporter permease [Halobacteriales archaeon QH_7_65_31]|nr:MAG: branched-chain amino acid ABC transporter permease [Halobacteriales archaeon QH_7_65_31]PSQ31298.1 MAG: branched-chain amino acid ABC transporter permease [Halobacteriales archaeon SW_6_65_46]